MTHEMFNAFMFGFCAGALAIALPILVLIRCRFGWHAWAKWALAGNGQGQFRTCHRCGYYGAKVFRDFTVTVQKSELDSPA